MKPCCQDPANREARQETPDLVVSVCQVCGCRHFELTVDPGKLMAEGKGL